METIITLSLPEDIAAHLTASGKDLARLTLEALALQEYRDGKLSTAQLRRLLGFQTRLQVHKFLKQHAVPLHYSMSDLEQDRTAFDVR